MSPFRSSRGQVAIFLILLFQVLFVFFAMSMNVGLVVYDKINLQNSVDLSAYYAAQKQAELLNQIAHINYQMRQAYKLLTFRIRVIGSLSIGLGNNSRLQPHPVRVGPTFSDEANSFFERIPGRHIPGVCIGSSLWHEYQITEPGSTVSLCKDLDSFSTVPSSGSSDPFGFTTGLNAYLDRVRAAISEKCKVVGVINWQLAASWYLAYVHEVTRRKEMIDQIADNMSLPGSDVKDFSGQSIFSGAQATFSKNLTAPQREATVEYKLVNSLSSDISGPCSSKDFWLPSIKIFPVVTYVSMLWVGNDCRTRVSTNRGNVPPADYLSLVGGRNNSVLQGVWNSGVSVPYGVEKNPWCMPYMGVSATTQPRKIFSPFGAPTTLKAEAFAKPFGGRIGPWYSNQWSSGDANSSGPTKVDRLLPARDVPSLGRFGGDPADDLVNHSKYPGDLQGMNSKYALGVMNTFFRSIVGNPMSNNIPPVFALAHYSHIGDPPTFESEPDSLARQNGVTNPDGNKVRLMEETALIPDIFDATYYSIEAQYSYNFHHPSMSQFSSFVNQYYPDLGSQNRNPYSVVTQLEKSRQVYTPGNYPFYSIEVPDHLLTGWTQRNAVSYQFPDNHFGKCIKRYDSEMETAPGPSGCPNGGRSGYSVKIVSKKYLKSVSADLGGPGNSGAILNPPMSD